MMNAQRKIFFLCIILVLTAILISGCGGSDSIVGKWEEPASGVSMQIGKDGIVTMSLKNASFNMNYELQDPDIMIFKASTDGTIPDQKMTYKVNKETLTLTVDGIDTIFYRKK